MCHKFQTHNGEFILQCLNGLTYAIMENRCKIVDDDDDDDDDDDVLPYVNHK